MVITQQEIERRKQSAMELTSFMVHKYYCENDVNAVINQMAEDIIWLGTGEHEFAVGLETVSGIFRQFVGVVPKCNISEESYQVIQITPESYLCSGRMWIATDASTQISLRVHQRITTVFRWADSRPLCCHIHISNPYVEMAEEEIGFPTKMAQQSLQYLKEQIAAQKAQIKKQTDVLRRLSYEDALTGLHNRNKFNQVLNASDTCSSPQLGVACFDLNGLKLVNDQQGHRAGDALIRNTANQLRAVFDGMTYRIGGDEFVVIDSSRNEEEFRAAVDAVRARMRQCGILCSVGISWRNISCNAEAQFEEADRMMYEDKRRFYSNQANDRRRERRRRERTEQKI